MYGLLRGADQGMSAAEALHASCPNVASCEGGAPVGTWTSTSSLEAIRVHTRMELVTYMANP